MRRIQRKHTIRPAAALALVLVLILGIGAAEPLRLAPDLAGTVEIPLTDAGAKYIYTYAYPQVETEDASAELINTFYQYMARDAEDFEIPMNADYYRGQNPETDVRVDIGYEVTCNSDAYFSVLLHTAQGELHTAAGHTFSRTGLKAGSSVALPYLLGLLENGETDSWLQDRQTAKADETVRRIVWERLQEMDGLEPWEDLGEESLEYGFFPEEDFYLDETGNPVFYLQPGFAEDSGRLLRFPISVEEILDEM